MIIKFMRYPTYIMAIGALSVLMAQNTGTITGTVKSASGNPVPNATVSVTQVNTNSPMSVLTGPDGSFSISVPPGTYRVDVEMVGFQRLSQPDVAVTAGGTMALNLTIEPGNSQAVQVTGVPPMVQDQSAQVTQTYSTEIVQQLPVLDRNSQQFVELGPGITPPQSLPDRISDPQASRAWATNGLDFRANRQNLDGTENDEPMTGEAIHVPTMDSTQEMHAVTGDYDASLGRAAGTYLNTETRSGTNTIHGSLFEMNSNEWFNARDFFDPRGFSIPRYNFNEFGGTVGGPIAKNKTFIFGSYEGDYLSQSIPTFTTVPTAAISSGNFSSIPGLNLVNPITGVAYPNNILPASAINPVSHNLLSYFPAPNLPGIQNNYFAQVPYFNEGQRADARLDEHFTDKTNLAVRYGYSNYLPHSPSVLGTAGGGLDGHLLANTAEIDLTQTFSPTLVGGLCVGYDLYENHINPIAGGPSGSDVGLLDTNLASVTSPLPLIQIEGMAPLGTAANLPAYNRDSNWNVNSDWSVTTGRHQIHFGADVWAVRLDGWQNFPYSSFGQFTFGAGPTLPGTAVGPYSDFGNAFASFLLGAPTQAAISSFSTTPSEYATMASGYVADTMRISRSFTLDIGLRYDFFQPLQPRTLAGVNTYNPVTDTLSPVGVNGINSYGNVNENTHNFGPRFGFAYHPLEHTVVRGGYGIMYWPGFLPFEAAAFNYGVNTFATGVLDGFGSVPFQLPAAGTTTTGPAPNAVYSYIPSNTRTPYVQSFNFDIQQDLGRGMMLDLGYVGDLARELPYTRDINAALPGTGVAGLPFNTAAFAQTEPILERATGLNSNYNGWQIKLNRRFTHGLAFNASYTFSKALDYGAGLLPLMNNVDVRANYGPANFDRTNVFTLGHVWELPFGYGTGRFNHGVLGHILGPWQLNGIFSYASGTPFTPTASPELCSCPGNTPTADLVSRGGASVTPYYTYGNGFGAFPYDFSIGSYGFAQPAPGTFGNIGRNAFRTDGFTNYDLSLFRIFQATERARVELRATAYNIANSSNFAAPITNINSAYFGQSLMTMSGLGPRMLQFGLRVFF